MQGQSFACSIQQKPSPTASNSATRPVSRSTCKLSKNPAKTKKAPMDELWSAAKVCRVANVMRRTRSRSSWVIRLQKSIPAFGIRHTLELRIASETLSCTQSRVENEHDKSRVPSNTINQKENYRSPTGDKKASKWFGTRRSFAFSVGFERTKLLILKAVVGAKGFEPSNSWSRTKYLNPINALSGVAYGTGSVISPS